jgi:phenylpyruvate tautomerase PptA (4-oxalocrotonate tautomerase family)
MPTFTCFTSPGALTPAQKDGIARVCTDVYHEEFGLARYLIQVIFCEVAVGDRYIAGQPAPPDLIWIRCDLREGRNETQKAKLLHRLRQGVADAANVSDEAIWIYLCDIPPDKPHGLGSHHAHSCPGNADGRHLVQVALGSYAGQSSAAGVTIANLLDGPRHPDSGPLSGKLEPDCYWRKHLGRWPRWSATDDDRSPRSSG